jgi:uncharacterized membrane-anchored protein YhcB (DUF1043 family)
LSEDNKELIQAINKLTNSVDKLTILFEFVKKELVEDYDNKNSSEELLKKLVQQNKVIAQGMVKLSDSLQGPNTNSMPSMNQNNSLNENTEQQDLFANQPQNDSFKSAPAQKEKVPGNPDFSKPQMDFTNFKSVNEPQKQEIPKPTEEKGFLGMFKK